MTGSQILTALLAASVMFLLVVGAASMMALIKGAAELRRQFRSASGDFSSVLLKSPLVPGVSVIVTARAFSAQSRALVRRLLDLHFGKHEVVLTLNGVSNADWARWVEELKLVRQDRTVGQELPAQTVRGFWVSREPLKLVVVEAEAGTGAQAYNAAINAAQFPVIGYVDPQAEFVPEWLLHVMRPLLEHWDGTAGVCAVAMTAPVDSLAGRIGALETLRRWMVRGAAFARWRKHVPIPGSCVLMKRDAVVNAGGFKRGIMELFLDLHAARQEIVFLPAEVSWPHAATTLTEVREQMLYDQAQLAAGLRYRAMRSSGEFTSLFCVRVLRPLVETFALLAAAIGLVLGWVHPALAAMALLASVGIGMTLSMAAVVFREVADTGVRDPRYLARLFLAAILENIGYRQLRNLWLIAGFAAPRRS